jgi:hypothetical protein
LHELRLRENLQKGRFHGRRPLRERLNVRVPRTRAPHTALPSACEWSKRRLMIKTIKFAASCMLLLTSACTSTSSSSSGETSREQARDYARATVGCKTDSDCCVVVDGCINQALVVGAADKDKVASLVSQPDPGGCTGCLLPAVQVTCDQGQCQGALIDVYSPDGGIEAGAITQLTQDHCGSVAGVVTTKATTPALTTQAIFGCGPM